MDDGNLEAPGSGDEARPDESDRLASSVLGRRARRASVVRWARAFATEPVWRDAVLPTAAIHVTLLVVAPFLLAVIAPEAVPHGDQLQIWNRWDTPHFLEIARYGYGPPAHAARIVLFPLYPALIALGSLVLQPLVAGMAISFVASLVAAAGIYRLTRIDHGRGTARAAVLAMNVFPTAYAFVAAYSEAPFLAFVAWALVAGRQRRWLAAGVLAGLAGATRLQGAFLVPALVVEYFVAERRIGRGAAWLLIGLAGPAIYLAINEAVFRDPFYFVGIQDTIFHVSNAAPWDWLPGYLSKLLAGAPAEYWVTVLLAPLVAFGVLGLATVWSIASKRAHAADAVFVALNFVSLITLDWPISVPRYLLGIAPVFVWLGTVLRRRTIGMPVLVASVVLLTVFTGLFVEGHWAF